MKEAYLLRGQGGRLTSQGVDHLAHVLDDKGVFTYIYDWQDWESARDDIDKRTRPDREAYAIGYSMGANALTWILNGVAYQGHFARGLRKAVLKKVFFLDPTWASVITPISNTHAEAGVHFQNHSLDPIGHGEIKRPSHDFKGLTVVPLLTSHLLVDKLPSVQKEILDAILL